jgi:hypothetical protein
MKFPALGGAKQGTGFDGNQNVVWNSVDGAARQNLSQGKARPWAI